MNALEEGNTRGAFVMCWTPAHAGHDGFLMNFLFAVWHRLGASSVLEGKGRRLIAQNPPLHVASETPRKTLPAGIIIKADAKLPMLFLEPLLDVYACKRKLNFNREMIS